MTSPVNGGSSGGIWTPGQTSGQPSIPSQITNTQSGLQSILTVLSDIDRKMQDIVTKAESFSGTMGGATGNPLTTMAASSTGVRVLPNYILMTPQGQNLSNMVGGTPTSQQAGSGGSNPSYSMKVRFGGVAVDAAASMGLAAISSAGTTAQQAYGNSIMFQRLSSASNMPFGNGSAAFSALQSGFSANGQYGYQSQSDLLDTANQMYNMGWGSAAMNAGTQQSMSAFAQATGNPLSGVSSMMAASISNPQTLIKARAFGITPLNRNGSPQAMQQTVNQVLQATWGGQAPSKAAVQAALSPYGNLRQNFENLGLSDDQISSMQTSIEAWAQNGGGEYTANSSTSNPLMASARRRAGTSTGDSVNQWGSLAQNMERANAAAANMDQWMGEHGWLQSAIGQIKGLLGGIGTVPGGTSPVGTAAKLAGEGLVARALYKGHGGTSLVQSALDKVRGLGADTSAPTDGLGVTAGDVGAAGVLGRLGASAGSASDYIPGVGFVLSAATMSQKTYDALSAIKLNGGITPGMKAYMAAHGGYGPGDAPSGGGSGLGHGAGNAGSAANAPLASYTTGTSVSRLLQVAQSEEGIPYVWGGGGTGGPGVGQPGDPGGNPVTGQKGFDCSGFTQYCFAKVGISLPRTTYEQVRCGVAVAPANVQAGDLVFFNGNTHVGIAMSASRFINAPYTGVNVQIDSYDPRSCSAIRRVLGAGMSANTSGTGAGGQVLGTSSLLEDTISSAMSGANVLAMNNVGSSIGMLGALTAGTAGATGSGASVPAAPSSVSGNTAVVKQMAASQYGWSGAEWNALYDLIMKESGFNNTAQNPTSTAYGIFQFLNNTWGDYGAAKTSDPAGQTRAGLKYIKSRYGDPENAWQHEVAHNWYDKGAWSIPTDQIAAVHKDEMVLPKPLADQVRDQVLGTGSSSGNTVNIYATFGDASVGSANRLIAMVKDALEESARFESIGTA